MKLIFQLSGENLELAIAEVKAVVDVNSYELDGNLMFVDSEPINFEHLAYTKAVYEFLFSCKETDLLDRVEKFDWSLVYNKSYYVVANDFDVKKIADKIWRGLNNPKADVKNPGSTFTFLLGKLVYSGRLLWENEEKFSSRRPHLNPGMHPISMSPKLARAMVNLAQAPKKSGILDPFCGIGGILIEAGLMGYKVKGYEIWNGLLGKARKNLEKYNIEGVIEQGDALTKVYSKYIVSDLPYGRNTTGTSMNDLYRDFILRCKKFKVERMVLGFSADVDLKSFFDDSDYSLLNIFTIYIHRSLQKKIVVLELPA